MKDQPLNEDTAIGDLLAVDPGVLNPGAALFRGGKLVAANRVRVDPDWKELDRDERCKRVASAIIRWGCGYNMEPRHLVYEWPQWYARNKSKGDPNDLAWLVGIGAQVSGQLSVALIARSITLRSITPLPAEWIDGLPKVTTGDAWDSPRGQRVRSRLEPEEVASIIVSHDSLDAVGLGLFALGRFARVRKFHRAPI